ncbi:MAG TPA: VIT domain-containing protein [Nannocystaceae bacterium]|nr:VIT domain-containing protein [Nannocystaceae bacterium]
MAKPTFSIRWLHALPLVALSCTPTPERAADAKPVDTNAAADGPSILPARSLAIEEDRSDLAPPLSLTASDGTGLRLVALKARARIEGPLAFTELELEFENPLPRRIEGRFEIELPSRAAISRFAMKLGKDWQEGEVVERQAARRAYEDFLHRRQDPALLEHDAGNSFGARVFPIEANARKQLIVSYSQELVKGGEPYRLPLRGLPSIDTLDVSATIAGSDKPALAWVERNVIPTHDFAVELAKASAIAIRHGEQALARVAVSGSEAPVDVEGLVVLFDTSASRAIGFDRRIRRLGAVLRALEADVGKPIPLEIVGFDQRAVSLFEGTTATLDDAALARIATRRALGASDIAGALRSVADKGSRRVLIVTDGVATTGSTELVGIERAASELSTVGITRIDAIADGSQSDDVLAAITTAPAMAPGVVIDARLDDNAMVHKLRTEAFEALDVHVPGATWVWPERVEGVQPGDELLVYAELPQGTAMSVGLGEHDAQATTSTDVVGPLLRRAWMRAYVQRLTDKRSRLLETDARGRDALQKMIVDVSVRERVLSEFTALLVLERESDYVRFGIDRRALADILAIGPSGVELVHRDGMPALAAVDPERLPEAPEWLRPPLDTSKGKHFGAIHRGVAGEIGVPGGVAGGAVDGDMGGGMPATERFDERPKDALVQEEGGSGRRMRGEEGRMAAPTTTAEPPPPADPGIADGQFADVDKPMFAEAAVEDEKTEAKAPAKLKKKPSHGWHEMPMPDLGRVTIGTAAIDGELPAADVAAELATRQPHLAWCAKHATPEKPVEFGTLTIDLVLDEHGAVTLARLRERDSLDARLTHCIETTASRWSFGASKPGVRPVIAVPLGFGATKPAAATKIDATELRREAAAIAADRLAQAEAARKLELEREEARRAEQAEIQRTVGSPYTGKLFDVMGHLAAGRTAEATELATAWQLDQPGDVLALVALGEVAEKAGDRDTAARAYGSIVDLFPSRADLRRYASYRLARVGGEALGLAIDSAREAVASRADHPSSHRALAFGLVAAGRHREAAQSLVAGLHAEHVEWGRFSEVQRILREDLALVAAAWAAAEPSARAEIDAMLSAESVAIATAPSLRFVLTWETDANDVDFHIHDGKGGHAFFSDKVLPSGGSLYADITTGYGPECFAIDGTAAAYPYNLRAHYYSRGPMGYGMGRVQAVQHDGKGTLVTREYPFVVMKDQEWIDLGTITGPLL